MRARLVSDAASSVLEFAAEFAVHGGTGAP
jgi:hypothetical protein